MTVCILAVTPMISCLADDALEIQHPLPHVRDQAAAATASPIGQSLPMDRSLPLPLAFQPMVDHHPAAPSDVAAPRTKPVDSDRSTTNRWSATKIRRRMDEPPDRATTAKKARPLSTMVSALSLVIGLFLGFVWLSRRKSGGSRSQLPVDVVQLLGRFPLSPKQEAHIVRFGSKILALAVSASGMEKLAELSDPEEVARLTALCLGKGGSSDVEFQQAIHRYAAEQENYRALARGEHSARH